MRSLPVTGLLLLAVCLLAGAGGMVLADGGGTVPLGASAGQAQARLTAVRVQLKWRHQFQFAGFYAALDQGYFRDAGLDVRLLEGGPGIDPAKVVTSNQAEFGIGTSSLLLNRADGMPVVAVASILQHSPYALAVRPDIGIETVHDLKGHSVMLEADSDELMAFLRLQGLEPQRLRLVPHSGDIRDLAGRIDAASIYTTDEPYDLISQKIPHLILTLRSAKMDFYGDTLFTSSSLAERDPGLVRAMRDALIKGWVYALEHQGAMVRLIHENYAPTQSVMKLQFEADEIRRLMEPDLVGVGYMNQKRWETIAQQFQSAGMLRRDFDLKGFLFEDIGMDGRHPQLSWMLLGIGVVSVLLMLLHLGRVSARLSRERRRRMRVEENLLVRGEADPLTGLPNRRRFEARGAELLAEMLSAQTPLALVILDIDQFQEFNRRWGREVGDELLLVLASTLATAVGERDLLGRFGGKTFAVLVPAASLDKARAKADSLRGVVALTQVTIGGGRQVGVTVSAGVACLEGGETDLFAMMERAERALFRAKSDGRNRVAQESVLPA